MRLIDKIFRMVTHRFYENHPCHSYTWFHKGYRYTISRVAEETEEQNYSEEQKTIVGRHGSKMERNANG